eukprot:1292268-Prymnesium_polylepis.1
MWRIITSRDASHRPEALAPHPSPIRPAMELRARRTGPSFVDIVRARPHPHGRLAGHSNSKRPRVMLPKKDWLQPAGDGGTRCHGEHWRWKRTLA